jgi:hypothetical protein
MSGFKIFKNLLSFYLPEDGIMKIPEDCSVKELLKIIEGNFHKYSEILNKVGEAPEYQGKNGEAPQLKELLHTLVGIQDEIVDYRLKSIIRVDHPYIPGIEVEKIKERSFYQNYSSIQLAESFLTQRRELLKLLHSLPSESWERTGVLEKEGHVSFKEFVRRMAEKDHQNIAELSRELVNQ